MSNTNERKALPGVMPQFTERWSPRAFLSKSVSEDALARMVEAARWSPSCFNDQPWRFYTNGQNNFDDYLACLVEGNQQWAKCAPVLGFIVGARQFSHNGKANDWFAFDCGAAWMSLALQARHEGCYAHAMAGFDAEKAERLLSIGPEEKVLIAFAVGYLGEPAQLPDELQSRENPSMRKSLADIWVTK